MKKILANPKRKTLILIFKSFLLHFVLILLTTSCSTLLTYPDDLTQEERFADFPLQKAPIKNTVKIRWDSYSIPFIEAKNDSDLAFAVGAVHAHLRIDQLELLRLLSQGRLSEVAGPFSVVEQVDYGLRMLNFSGAAKNSWAIMSEESREWITNFTAGLNWYIKNLKKTPITHQAINRDVKEFTTLEVITLSQVVASDLSWAIYIKYLKLAENKGWEKIFHRQLEEAKNSTATFDNSKEPAISSLIKSFSKSGSNSVVVSGKKSDGPGALIANDPHVGLFLPNFWLLMGIKSPSYHAFGMMIPGVPIIGVGRNKHIAWGGTNMRGISSHLFDVSDLPESEITLRSETLKRRWLWSKTVDIRETEYGPILSDLDFFDKEKLPFKVALDWVGRKGSDGIQTFLDVAKASNWEEFKKAFRAYNVSAMNMVYADDKGNIGMVAAYGQPVLKDSNKTLELVKKRDNPIVRIKSPLEHPNPYNPSENFIASANNKPFESPEIPFAFGYANNDRVERLKEVTSGKKKIKIEDLKKLQTDNFSRKSFQIAQRIVGAWNQTQEFPKPTLIKELSQWDGHYKEDSSEALSFYGLSYSLWQHYLKRWDDQPLIQQEEKDSMAWKDYLLTWLKDMPEERIVKLSKDSIVEVEEFKKEFNTWGEFLLQKQSTPLGMLPLVGERFRFENRAVSGSSDTVNKYNRRFDKEKEATSYGASARHISDLSSLDENYFVLNGGQDAWILNDQINDQAALWKRNEYIKIPLSWEKVKMYFSKKELLISPQ